MTPAPRRTGVRIMVVLASLSLLLAVVSGYLSREVVDANRFTTRATAALDNPDVRSLVVARITDQIVSIDQPDLTVVRPLIASAVDAAVATRAFRTVFADGARELHAAVMNGSLSRLTLNVADLGTLILPAPSILPRSIADTIRSLPNIELISRRVSTATRIVAQAARVAEPFAVLCTILFVVLAAGALALSRERLRTLGSLGAGAAVAGAVLFLGLLAGRAITVSEVQGAQGQAAAGAVWDAYLRDLGVLSLIIAAAGAAVAALAWVASRVAPAAASRDRR